MEHKKKMVKYGDEEISEELLLKIQQDTIEKNKKETENICKGSIEKDKIEMAYKCLEKSYQCSVCKISPRPGAKSVKKRRFCRNIFCEI